MLTVTKRNMRKIGRGLNQLPVGMSYWLFPKRVFTLYQRSTTRIVTGLLTQRKCVVHLNRLMGVWWLLRMIPDSRSQFNIIQQQGGVISTPIYVRNVSQLGYEVLGPQSTKLSSICVSFQICSFIYSYLVINGGSEENTVLSVVTTVHFGHNPEKTTSKCQVWKNNQSQSPPS